MEPIQIITITLVFTLGFLLGIFHLRFFTRAQSARVREVQLSQFISRMTVLRLDAEKVRFIKENLNLLPDKLSRSESSAILELLDFSISKSKVTKIFQSQPKDDYPEYKFGGFNHYMRILLLNGIVTIFYSVAGNYLWAIIDANWNIKPNSISDKTETMPKGVKTPNNLQTKAPQKFSEDDRNSTIRESSLTDSVSKNRNENQSPTQEMTYEYEGPGPLPEIKKLHKVSSER